MKKIFSRKSKYSLSEELINAISHGLGAVFGIVITVACLIKSIGCGDGVKIFSSLVYGLSVIFLYLMSTLYHSFKEGKAKSFFRIIDHCTIFLLIMGSYTPYTLITLAGLKIGKVIFCIVWGVGVLGIILNAVSLKKFAFVSYVCYVVVGWVVLVAIKPLIANLHAIGFLLLLLGGVFYTLGAVIYAVGKKRKYFHSIFHFLCLTGTILQFVSIYNFVL